MVNGKPRINIGGSRKGKPRRIIGGIRRKVLDIPKGRVSALPKGNIITKGLRAKKPLAQRVVQQARFSQRTGIAPKTIGFVGVGRKRKRSIDGSSVLGFRMDGRLP